MIKLELSAFQVQDLQKLVAAKLKRVNENGDAPYWRALAAKLADTLDTQCYAPIRSNMQAALDVAAVKHGDIE